MNPLTQSRPRTQVCQPHRHTKVSNVFLQVLYYIANMYVNDISKWVSIIRYLAELQNKCKAKPAMLEVRQMEINHTFVKDIISFHSLSPHFSLWTILILFKHFSSMLSLLRPSHQHISKPYTFHTICAALNFKFPGAFHAFYRHDIHTYIICLFLFTNIKVMEREESFKGSYSIYFVMYILAASVCFYLSNDTNSTYMSVFFLH